MSLGDHLEDLRKRILYALLGIIPLLVVAFAFGRPILTMLIDPARKALLARNQSSTLLATGPFETFGTIMLIALVITVLLGSPWLIYQLFKFISPGLYAHERRFVYILIPMSMALTLVSILFMYFIILPVILQFFIGYSSSVGGLTAEVAEPPPGMVFATIPVLQADPPAPEIGHEWINLAINQRRACVGYTDGDAPAPIIRGIELTSGTGIIQQYRISEYVRTMLNMALAFGVGFQMPVVVLMLGWLGIVRPPDLRRFRKYILLGCCIASALLTPADPLSMMLLAIPLYGLFEFGLILLTVLPVERVVGGQREGPDAGDE